MQRSGRAVYRPNTISMPAKTKSNVPAGMLPTLSDNAPLSRVTVGIHLEFGGSDADVETMRSAVGIRALRRAVLIYPLLAHHTQGYGSPPPASRQHCSDGGQTTEADKEAPNHGVISWDPDAQAGHG